MGFSEDPTNTKCLSHTDILKILFSNLYGKQNILQKHNCYWVRVDKLQLNKQHIMKWSESHILCCLNIFAKWFVKSLSLMKSWSKLNLMGAVFTYKDSLKDNLCSPFILYPNRNLVCIALLLWQYDWLAVDCHFQKRWTAPKKKKILQ